ncbi:hypothetical protein BJF84_10080 [Rhodococcus sp. CUA-806]|nr:hypothetical protein BJF84_10080 [Rhodococcus sp. CUA-806]
MTAVTYVTDVVSVAQFNGMRNKSRVSILDKTNANVVIRGHRCDQRGSLNSTQQEQARAPSPLH